MKQILFCLFACVVMMSSLSAVTTANASSANLNPQVVCIAQAVSGEARGESPLGQALVAKAIMNRVTSGTWPATPCGVVSQPNQFDGFRKVAIRNIPAGIVEIAQAAYAHQLAVPSWAWCIQYFATRPMSYMHKKQRLGGHWFGCPAGA